MCFPCRSLLIFVQSYLPVAAEPDFWPRSRRARAKQVLALDGERSMIQQTVERLKPLASPEKTWVITNEFLAQEIADQLTGVPRHQIVEEPVARNTAPACGLAAFLIERENPEAVLGVFPSDHVIADEPRFLKALQKGIALAAAGDNIVVLGIEPTRAETGYGYIETGDDDASRGCAPGSPVYGEAESESRPGVCGRRQLLLELGHVPVVGEDAGQCGARASAGDGSAAREDRRKLWNAGVRRGISRAVSEVRKHFGGLRGAGAAVGKGRARCRISTACRRSLRGTIWARGRRSTSTRWRRGCAAMATATWPSRTAT